MLSRLGLCKAESAERPGRLPSAPRTPLGVQAAVTGVHPFAQGPPGGGSHTSIQVRGGLSGTADPPLRVTAGSHRPRPRLPGQSPCGTRVRGRRTLMPRARAAHGRSGADVLGQAPGAGGAGGATG